MESELLYLEYRIYVIGTYTHFRAYSNGGQVNKREKKIDPRHSRIHFVPGHWYRGLGISSLHTSLSRTALKSFLSRGVIENV